MSKQRDRMPHEMIEDQAPVAKETEPEQMVVTSWNENQPVTMEMARRCPLCYGNHKGTGTQYSADDAVKYYRCETCGHTWSARIYIEKIVIEHKRVTVSTRNVGQRGQ